MILVVLLFATPVFVHADWQPGGHGAKWALGCKFNTQPFWEARVKGEHCEMYCDLNYKCDHFYWAPPPNENVNGTCYMMAGYKQGVIQTEDAPSIEYACGYFVRQKRGWREGGHHGMWAMGCDFKTTEIIATSRIKCDFCEMQCAKSRHRCDHFTCLPPGPDDEGKGLCQMKNGFTMGIEPSPASHDWTCGYIDRAKSTR